MRTVTKKEIKAPKTALLRKIKKHSAVYMLFLPTLLFYLIYKYVPMFGNIMAFQDFSVAKGVTGSEFIGIKHFADFFSNYKFEELLRNTLTISGLTLLIGFPLPIIFALLLNETKNLRFKKSVQTITYMPHFISSVVIVSILNVFVSSDGVINEILVMCGQEPVQFMITPKYFPWIYVFTTIWQQLGWDSIIYISAIAGVDQELYEAARVDGANRFQLVKHVTLPGITSTIVVLLILKVGQLLTVGYEKIILMYNPAIYETADVISTYVYRKGLLETNYGYSTAVSMFNSVCNFVLLLSANFVSKRMSGEGLW